jgi:hypothetical protein
VQPLDYDDEIRDFIVEAYRINPVTGRRMYREVILSRPKGRAKSEIAGMIAVAEGFAPVRFDGWDADGQPVARPVVSPLIKCLATEEGAGGQHVPERSLRGRRVGTGRAPGDLRRGAVCAATSRRRRSTSPVAVRFGPARAGRRRRTAAKRRSSCRTRSHLYVLPELKAMYGTVMRNLPKRRLADPWALPTTTAYRPGEQSIAEEKLTAWRKGELSPTVLVDHREARGKIDIDDRDHTRQATAGRCTGRRCTR